MKSSSLFLIYLAFGSLLFSCSDDAYFDETYSFDNNTWQDNDTAIFIVDVDNVNMNFDFYLTLRNTKKYAYSNLWVNIETIAPDDSKSVISQRIDITNPDGSWKGRTTGSLVENRLYYKTTAFPLEGQYKFNIYQSVQQEKVNEVMDIGLRIVPKVVNR